MATESKTSIIKRSQSRDIELEPIATSIRHIFYKLSSVQLVKLEEARKKVKQEPNNAEAHLVFAFLLQEEGEIALVSEKSNEFRLIQDLIHWHLERMRYLYYEVRGQVMDGHTMWLAAESCYKYKRYQYSIDLWKTLLAYHKAQNPLDPIAKEKAECIKIKILYELSRAYEKISKYTESSKNIFQAISNGFGKNISDDEWRNYKNLRISCLIQYCRMQIKRENYIFSFGTFYFLQSIVSTIGLVNRKKETKRYCLATYGMHRLLCLRLFLSACSQPCFEKQIISLALSLKKSLITLQEVEQMAENHSEVAKLSSPSAEVWRLPLVVYDKTVQQEDYAEICGEYEALLLSSSTQALMHKAGYAEMHEAMCAAIPAKTLMSAPATPAASSASNAVIFAVTSSPNRSSASPTAPSLLSGSHFNSLSVAANEVAVDSKAMVELNPLSSGR